MVSNWQTATRTGTTKITPQVITARVPKPVLTKPVTMVDPSGLTDECGLNCWYDQLHQSWWWIVNTQIPWLTVANDDLNYSSVYVCGWQLSLGRKKPGHHQPVLVDSAHPLRLTTQEIRNSMTLEPEFLGRSTPLGHQDRIFVAPVDSEAQSVNLRPNWATTVILTWLRAPHWDVCLESNKWDCPKMVYHKSSLDIGWLVPPFMEPNQS